MKRHEQLVIVAPYKYLIVIIIITTFGNLFSATCLAVAENLVLCGYKLSFIIHVTLCSTWNINASALLELLWLKLNIYFTFYSDCSNVVTSFQVLHIAIVPANYLAAWQHRIIATTRQIAFILPSVTWSLEGTGVNYVWDTLPAHWGKMPSKRIAPVLRPHRHDLVDINSVVVKVVYWLYCWHILLILYFFFRFVSVLHYPCLRWLYDKK